MRSTFNLKKPNKANKSLILFSSYFKNEGRKFVYSTGETIDREDWDFDNKRLKNLNEKKESARIRREIQAQLDRYKLFFDRIISEYKIARREIIISEIKREFDKEFKRTKGNSNNFFFIYNKFLQEKINDYSDQAVSETTIKRYTYNMKLLQEFEVARNKKIHFNQINKQFYNSFLKFCIEEKKHAANTLRRNVGLLKTFLYWALENNYTYKNDFQKFKAPKAQETNEIALNQKEIDQIFEFDLSHLPKLEKVRDLFILGCSTGLRISNYGKISKTDIDDNNIQVRDKKNKEKLLTIPLNDYSNFILKKYNFQLPAISTQKFNEYIKEVFKLIGFDREVKKELRLGKEIIETTSPMYERISSHTARRSFITIMKNNKVPDKLIMDITGHKSLEVFNKYYKPSEIDKSKAMQMVWKKQIQPLKVAR